MPKQGLELGFTYSLQSGHKYGGERAFPGTSRGSSIHTLHIGRGDGESVVEQSYQLEFIFADHSS